MPNGGKVIFANTGKERPETLDFVERCSQRWDVKIVWLEYDRQAEKKYRIVDYSTASRQGEPFKALIKQKMMLPNPVMRFCTQWLKIKPSNRYARFEMGWKHYNNAIGLRADEPRRVAKQRPEPKSTPGEEPCAPLARAGATLQDVTDFWKAQPFDLCLAPEQGNCDLCFLKSTKKVSELIRQNPSMADWWAEAEAEAVGKTRLPGVSRFRKDRPSYASLKRIALSQTVMPFMDDDLQECRCTD